MVAASFSALVFGCTCVYISFHLFVIIQPTTLHTACARFTPSWLVSLWIVTKLVQIAVSIIIPFIRMWFAGKLRRLQKLVYIFLLVDTLQTITDHLITFVGCNGGQQLQEAKDAQQLQQARDDVEKELQQSKDELAKLRVFLVTEICEMSEILFDMQLVEQGLLNK